MFVKFNTCENVYAKISNNLNLYRNKFSVILVFKEEVMTCDKCFAVADE